MTAPKVAIRLGTEGKEDAKRDFREYGDAGDAAANRVARSFERASQDLESAQRRQAAAAQKLAAIMPQTAMQMRINDAVGTGSSMQEGSARVSAGAFRELIAQQERYEQVAARIRAELDPLYAATQRYNMALQEAKAAHAAGALSADLLAQKELQLKEALDLVSSAHRGGTVSAGQYKAGAQQLGFQMQDLGVQLSMAAGSTDVLKGTMTALAMQGPQVVSAIALMRGSAGGLIGFLSGPWGAAFLAATSVAGMLIPMLWNTKDAAHGAADGLDDAARAAKELEARWGRIKALGDMRSSGERQRDDIRGAAQDLIKLQQQRAQLAEIIARGGGTRAEMTAQAVRRQELAELDRQIAGKTLDVGRAELANRKTLEEERRKATTNLLKVAASGSGRARGGGRSSASSATDEKESVFVTNDRWARNQDVGATARALLDQEGSDIAQKSQLIREMNDEISAGTALLQIEWEARGKSRKEIEAAIEMKRFELSLQERGISLESMQGQELLKRKAAQISLNMAIGDGVDKMQAMRTIGADAISTILNPNGWKNWKSMALGAISDVTQALWKMAVINPIQNRLGGGSLPTIGNLLGLLGGGAGLGGVNASSMSYMNGLAAAIAVPRNLMGSAIGNNFTPAGAHLVGENGPEIVNMPLGAQVMTASESRRLMQNSATDRGDTHVHVYADNALVTEQIVGMIAQGMDVASVRGAAGGAAMATAENVRRARRSLGRNW